MNSTGDTILLVDDDPSILVTIGDQLEAEGYAVVKATSVDAALRALQTHSPSLIILDMRMPGKSGLSLLKEVTAADGALRYPVLVFTARGEMEDFFDETRVDGFLAKTADPSMLSTEVARIIAKHRPELEASRSGSARLRVLIAEDESTHGNRLVSLLSQSGYDALCLRNGYELIEAAILHRPDVIVLKQWLPEGNGSLVASMLAALPSLRSVPVVLYDDSGMHHDGAQYPHVRVFVPKRDEKELLDAVEFVIKAEA